MSDMEIKALLNEVAETEALAELESLELSDLSEAFNIE